MIRCPLALLPLCLPLLLMAPELAFEPPALELLGTATLGSGTTFEGTTVGGLSALVYDPQRNRYLALSDGPGHGGPARFYTLEIGIADGILEPGEVRVTGVTEIRPESGRPAFTKSNFDPEGLAPSHHGTLYVSSEGNAEDGIPPLVAEMTSDGRLLHRFPLPPAFRPSARPARGVRLNLAFEPLTVTPSGTRLITGTENALVQDGPKASLTGGSPSRLVVYDTRSRRVVKQALYWTEPVAEPPLIPGTFKINGLVELLAVDETRLLALERSFSLGRGNSVRLFLVDLDAADDLSGRRKLSAADLDRLEPVGKRLLLDLATLGVELDNLEGMTWGPELPDGRRTLVLIADDNFSPLQRTQVLAFAVSPRSLQLP